MTSSEVWDKETAATYDDDAASQFASDVLVPTVDYLERLSAQHRTFPLHLAVRV